MTVANTDLTQGSALTTSADYVVTGTGIFDDLMEAVNIHLDAQFHLGRITGADYATVYLGAMQSALQNSASFTLGKEKTNAESAVLGQKEITEYAQTQQTTKTAPHADSILGKQSNLYGEQAKGFKWNADQKYLKTLMDAWSINVSTAGVAATNITAINATGTGNLNTQITNAEPT
jgi:hypothetical protein